MVPAAGTDERGRGLIADGVWPLNAPGKGEIAAAGPVMSFAVNLPTDVGGRTAR